MTPRLKKLLVGFAISLVILVSDRLSQTSSDSTVKEEKVKRRARTAKIGSNRTKRFKEQAERAAKRLAPKDYTPSQEFIPIPENVHALADWGRNPFTDREPTPVRQVNQPVKSKIVREEVVISNVNALKIESVATLGDKTFVIINGQRFQVGDKIDNMRIETIENNRITFKTGTKIIVKNVGS